MTAVWTVAGAVLLFLGSVSSLLSLNLETCTGNEANSLFGGVFSVALYALGFAALARARSVGVVIAVSLLPALVAIAHSVFAVRFLIGYLGHGMTSCEALFALPYGTDGSERFHIALWIATSLVFWFGLGVAVRAARQRNFE